jgi:hypothetical protein
MMHPHQQAQTSKVDLRRSKRVPAQLPVVVEGESAERNRFEDPTRAVILSAHGCLLTLSESVRLGQKLLLRNVASREQQDCRVVYLGEQHGGRTEVGLRFKAPAPQFWGLAHPPADWNKFAN